jgi:hypothetical protein
MARRNFIIPLTVLTVIIAASIFAQSLPADTTRIDTTLAVDTSAIDTLSDTIITDSALLIDSLAADSLTDAERAQRLFEERREQLAAEQAEKKRLPRLSYFDSAATCFLPARSDLKPLADRSFVQGAGDYLRLHPSFFTVDYLETPGRNTAQPFGLTGSRLNVLLDGQALAPFEHAAEPDGLMDLNDIPTAVNEHVWVVPGPLGVLLGGESAVATLYTRPADRPVDDYSAHSAFLLDKGQLGYSYARARYSKRFTSGRLVDLSVGYRNADGAFFLSDDDAYHYYGKVYSPISGRLSAEVSGRLYNREGNLPVQPDVSGPSVNRDRFDRTVSGGLVWHSAEHTAAYSLVYRHSRNSSDINLPYKLKLNRVSHGVTLARDWTLGSHVFRIETSGDYLHFDDGRLSWERRWASGGLAIVGSTGGWRYGLRAMTRYYEDLDFVPSAAAALTYVSDLWLLTLSGGWVERAPSLYENHLPFSRATLYPFGTLNYAEQGNKDLETERQLTGSATVHFGKTSAFVEASVTGGRIRDGIDWQENPEVIDGNTVRVFRPLNGDVEFIDVSLRPEVSFLGLATLSAGAAYRQIDYQNNPAPAYTPEYQGWAGLELSYHWRQRGVRFLGYGEVVYTGPYDGLFTTGLGEEPIFNAVTSIQLSSFEFHFTFRNVLSTVYQQRESSSFLGRFFTFGLVWNFID